MLEEQLRDEKVALLEPLSHGLHPRPTTPGNDLLGGSPRRQRFERRLLYAGLIERDDLLPQPFEQLGRGTRCSRGRRHFACSSLASLNP